MTGTRPRRHRPTEPLWETSQAAVLVPVGEPTGLVEATCRLLSDAPRRQSLAAAGKALYDQHFDVRHTLAALRRMAGEQTT